MIVSVSRRTDIPAFYSDWFFNRLREGFTVVRNPVNHRQLSRISLSSDVVDCFVFWTKNPTPMLPRLPELSAYSYYFTITLTGYGRGIEPGVPDKEDILLAMRQLSAQLGAFRVVWRYDPILISAEYNTDWHLLEFERLAAALSGVVERCVFSFLDVYRCNKTALQQAGIRPPEEGERRELVAGMAEIAGRYGICLQTCAEADDFTSFGITVGACIDPLLINRVTGATIETTRDFRLRPYCGCCASVDIGDYDLCPAQCIYCYANHGTAITVANVAAQNPASPILIGELPPLDSIPEKKVFSQRLNQISLF